jgi:hypothetical protein
MDGAAGDHVGRWRERSNATEGDGMATVRKEVVVGVPLKDVWDAVRDFGALHERLARGSVTDTRLEGEDRIVTFLNGTVMRERLISVSDAEHRLVWTILDGPWTHHNGSVELYEEGEGRTRFVWTTDILPHELDEATEQSVEEVIKSIRATLEGESQKVAAP